MAVTFDGTNKVITLDTATTWNFHDDIYLPMLDWAVLSGNMQYLLPCSGEGKASLGASVYTDAIYKLLNGWKLQPSGYAAGTQVTVAGTLITDDSSARTIAPSVGSAPVWVFQVATDATIVATVSGAITGIESSLGVINRNVQKASLLIPATENI